MLIAIARAVGPAIQRCELTHLARTPIDVERARQEHADYVTRLQKLGCRVQTLPAAPELPDAIFVEDVAVVFDEIAVMTRPGRGSRRAETPSIAAALAPYRSLRYVTAPATLDGGDVLRVGRTVYVGISGRTSAEGVAQMHRLLDPYGYTVVGVPVAGCLHLKSAVTQVGQSTLLVNPKWVSPTAFDVDEIIEVAPTEDFAANGLLIGATVIYPAAFAATRRRLEAAGIAMEIVDVAEIAKAEGAVTCCSLLFAA